MSSILDDDERAACDEYTLAHLHAWAERTGNSITITDPLAIERVVRAFTSES